MMMMMMIVERSVECELGGTIEPATVLLCPPQIPFPYLPLLDWHIGLYANIALRITDLSPNQKHGDLPNCRGCVHRSNSDCSYWKKDGKVRWDYYLLGYNAV
jgi:hypothetical protein